MFDHLGEIIKIEQKVTRKAIKIEQKVTRKAILVY